MVGLRTNRLEYSNDIAEEIRLFLGLTEIEPANGEDDDRFDLVFDLLLTNDGEQHSLSAAAGPHAVFTSFTIPAEASSLFVKKIEKRRLKLACYQLLKQLYPEVAAPWGSLTGIRPTKLFRELTQEGGLESARDMFTGLFDVSAEKTALAESICAVQEPYINSVSSNDIDLYIGIPYCRTKCLYCSFPSEVLSKKSHLEEYLAALKREIEAGAELVKQNGFRVRSFYMGGGTPTVLSAGQLEDLLSFTLEQFGSFGLESTVEAGRPDTIDREKLEAFKRLGISRISINPQTMNDATLLRVGRAHTAADVVRVYELAREVGFDSINMDLIAGLPGETPEEMRSTCERIVQLAPECLTVHSLAIKRSARLKTELEEYALASAEDAQAMARLGAEAAERLGMRAYYMYRQKYMSGNLENIGYAIPGKECVYNIDMMEETASILAFGAGTMTKRVISRENRIERLPNPKDVPTYLEKLDRLIASKQHFFSEE
ncbi:MAG: coproporphyrinogen dehydrogenase HemZ [Clostridiaceae bacterium]